jgi:hypothetical protein
MNTKKSAIDLVVRHRKPIKKLIHCCHRSDVIGRNRRWKIWSGYVSSIQHNCVHKSGNTEPGRLRTYLAVMTMNIFVPAVSLAYIRAYTRGSIQFSASSRRSRPVLVPTQRTIQWIPRGTFPGGKAAGPCMCIHYSCVFMAPCLVI